MAGTIIHNTHDDLSLERNGCAFERLAVVGAGNMGSGIAQKMATKGFAITLVNQR